MIWNHDLYQPTFILLRSIALKARPVTAPGIKARRWLIIWQPLHAEREAAFAIEELSEHFGELDCAKSSLPNLRRRRHHHTKPAARNKPLNSLNDCRP